MMKSRFHLTRERPTVPYTEPYEFWVARRKMQQKAIKVYLRGTPVWRSMMLLPVYERGTKLKIVGTKRVQLQGTYVAPVCPLCDTKEKRCKCWKEVR